MLSKHSLKKICLILFLGFVLLSLPAKYICAEGAKGFWCSTSKMGVGTYYAHYKHPKINHFGGHLSVSSLYWKERFSIGADISGGLGEQKISSDFFDSAPKNSFGGFLGFGLYSGVNLGDFLKNEIQNPFILHFSTSFHFDNYGLRNNMPDTLFFTLGAGLSSIKTIDKFSLEYSLNYSYVVYGSYRFIERKNPNSLAISRRSESTIGHNSHEAKASLAITYNSFYAKFSCIYRFLDDSKEVWVKKFSTDSTTYRLGYPHTHNLITMLEVGYSFGEFGK